MPQNKTNYTDASVAEYIDSRANEQQRADCKELMAIFKKITKKTPKMFGPSIVGYGSFTYTYDTGRSGESPLAAFAIRGRDLVVYLSCEEEKNQSLLSKLGKHKMGKSCLYFRQFDDLDRSVFEKLVVASIQEAKDRYGF